MNTKNKFIYPKSAYYDIFGELNFDMPPDAEETLEYIAGTLLKRETDMFIQRYKEETTYEDIGEKYGLTKERVRQILARALRKLRQPKRARILLMGRKTYLNKEITANEDKKKQYNECIEKLEMILENQNAEIVECKNKLNCLIRVICGFYTH